MFGNTPPYQARSNYWFPGYTDSFKSTWKLGRLGCWWFGLFMITTFTLYNFEITNIVYKKSFQNDQTFRINEHYWKINIEINFISKSRSSKLFLPSDRRQVADLCRQKKIQRAERGVWVTWRLPIEASWSETNFPWEWNGWIEIWENDLLNIWIRIDMKANICHKSQKIHPKLLFFEGFWTLNHHLELRMRSNYWTSL